MIGVRYPEWRENITDAVRALADANYQRRVWIDRRPGPDEPYDTLDYNVHELFDDSNVLSDPSGAVGVLLASETEAAAFRSLGNVLGALIDDLGDAPDARYLADPRWPLVIARARDVLAVLGDATAG